jgi:hypothetical protein
MQTNANECKRMQTNANECKRMQTNANECQRMPTNANERQRTPTNANERKQTPTNANKRKQTNANKRKQTQINAKKYLKEIEERQILYLNGKTLLDMPIKERRVLLEKNVNVIPYRVELSELTIDKHSKKKGKNWIEDRKIEDEKKNRKKRKEVSVARKACRIYFLS